MSSCSNLSDKLLKYDIILPEVSRICFESKGAVAGMMLSGTMGSMAIDEGISKGIDATAIKYGFKIYPGDDDLVVPVLKVGFMINDIVEYQLSFPKTYINDDFYLPENLINSLDDIESNDQIIQKIFQLQWVLY